MVEPSHWATRTGGLLLTSILSLGLGELTAQEGRASRGQAAPTPRAERSQRVLFDRVIGIIGDRVILASTIEEELRAIEESGTPLNQRERSQRGLNILRRIAQEEIWVQFGKLIGGQSPEEYEAYINREVTQRMAEQEQRFGSFTRFNEELGNIGESRGALASQVRNRLLSDIGRSSALGQPSQSSPLMVTPKAMRRYFEENPEQFSIQGEVELEWMIFRRDLAGVGERMALAAKAWAEDGADSEQVAKQFGGRFRGVDRVRDDPEDHHAEVIKSFALRAELGQVSAPIGLGRSYRLLKVARVTIAREEEFTDPRVQERIGRILRKRQFLEAQSRVIQQNSAKMLIWPPELRDALNGMTPRTTTRRRSRALR